VKKTNLIIVLILSVFFANAQNTIYVATTGDDNSGDGSISNPYGTIQYALNQTSDNDTVVLRGGTYTSNEIRINNNNITIKSYPNEWAIIQAPTNVQATTSCIWYHEPTIVGGRLERLEIIGGYLYGVKLESDWNWGAAIPDRHGTKNIVITHCKIHDTGRDCVKIPSGCDSITVRNCTIYNSGIGVSNDPNNPNAEGIDLVNDDDAVICNNFVYNTSTSGIYSKGGSINSLIENNLVMNTGESGIMLGFYTDEEWFDSIANPNYYENLYGTLRNNIIINTQMDGIGLYAAYHPRVYNNTVINAAQNDHASLFFNTGYMWLDEINDMIAPPCVDVYVVNNIFTVTSNNPNAQIRYYDDDTTSNMQGNCIVNNNLYFKAGGATFDDGIDWQTLDLTAWQASTGYDANTLEANPLLDANYHLTSASPCIDAAQNITDLTIDYDGNTRTQPFDIGADEYGAGNNLQTPPDTNTLGTGGDIIITSIFSTDNKSFDVKIYPNPASSFVKIESSDVEQISIQLLDITGKVVNCHSEHSEKSITIDISDLQKGIYLILINEQETTEVKKLIIK